MRVIVCLPADDAVPWLDLFAAALPDARVERREPDAPVAAGAPRADYVVAACPCRTVFAEQPAPKAVFAEVTVWLGVIVLSKRATENADELRSMAVVFSKMSSTVETKILDSLQAIVRFS